MFQYIPVHHIFHHDKPEGLLYKAIYWLHLINNLFRKKCCCTWFTERDLMLARYAYPPLSYEPVLSRFQTIPATIQKAPENINGSSYTWGTNAPGDRDVYVLPKSEQTNKTNSASRWRDAQIFTWHFFPLFHVVWKMRKVLPASRVCPSGNKPNQACLQNVTSKRKKIVVDKSERSTEHVCLLRCF